MKLSVSNVMNNLTVWYCFHKNSIYLFFYNSHVDLILSIFRDFLCDGFFFCSSVNRIRLRILMVSILHITYAHPVQIRFVYKFGKWNLNIKISKNNAPHMNCVHLVKFYHISAIKSKSYSTKYNRTECPTSQRIYFCTALNNLNL